MCLWKDRFEIDDLVESTDILIHQLRLLKKGLSTGIRSVDAEYVDWLSHRCCKFQLDRIANSLLSIAETHISLQPLVARILWQIELRQLLPDRHLQMEYIQLRNSKAKLTKKESYLSKVVSHPSHSHLVFARLI